MTDKIPRCPKCKSTEFSGFVIDSVEQSATIKDGKAVGGWWGPSSLVERTGSYGACGCGHRWKFRDAWALS